MMRLNRSKGKSKEHGPTGSAERAFRRGQANLLALLGPVASGKTGVLAWLQYNLAVGNASRYFREREISSAAIKEQYRRLAEGRFFARTAPSDGAELDHQNAASERLFLERLDHGPIDILALAGEETEVLLRSGQLKDLQALADEFAQGQNRILGIVLNPMLMSYTMAVQWFRAMICHLSGLYDQHLSSVSTSEAGLGCDGEPNEGTLSLLRTAIETAARVLFGLPAEELHNLHPLVRGRFTHLPNDARLVCDFSNPDPLRRYRIESSELGAHETDGIFEAMDTVAATVAAKYIEALPSMRSLAERTDQLIVLLTRLDLARLLERYVDPHRIRTDCLRHFKRSFEPHQVVEMNHFSLGFERDWRRAATCHDDAVFIHTAKMSQKTDSLDDLVAAIDEESKKGRFGIDRPADRSGLGMQDGETGRASLVGFQVLRLAPLVMLAAMGVCLFVTGGLLWPSLWRWLVGGACLLGAVWAWLLYARGSRPPVWDVVGEGTDQEIYLDAIAPRYDASPGELTIRETAMSRMFDVGWVKRRGKKVMIPKLKRFKACTGIEAEDNPSSIIVDAAAILILAVGFIVAAGSYVIS